MRSMAHIFCTLTLGTALLLCHPQAGAFPQKSQIQPYGQNAVANGYARRGGKSVVDYTETYLDDPMSSTIRASYWDGNREAIAFKQLDFGDNPNVPDFFEVIDYRRATAYRITVNSNLANVKVLKIAEDGSETVTLNKNVEIDSNTVIDAAFHRFVISNWDRLMKGKTVKVQFLQIDKARLVPLKIKKSKCDTPDTACFKITFDNILLQNIVPNIRIKYDSDKRLIRYNGIGPVTRMNGKGLPVDIMYDYLK